MILLIWFVISVISLLCYVCIECRFTSFSEYDKFKSDPIKNLTYGWLFFLIMSLPALLLCFSVVGIGKLLIKHSSGLLNRKIFKR